MTVILDEIGTTAEITVPEDPFDKILGQDHAVEIVRSAVRQRRHVLLCGVPGVGKSMIAKAAYTLLQEPREEIRIQPNPLNPERPCVEVVELASGSIPDPQSKDTMDTLYARPDEIPSDIAVKMGYRCPRCQSYSLPEHNLCMECGAPKPCDWEQRESYHGLFRVFDVVGEPATSKVARVEETMDGRELVTYRRAGRDTIVIQKQTSTSEITSDFEDIESSLVLVPKDRPRFVRASGASPVELLGDVKHDPYGSAENLGKSAHERVIPGAVHEAHEGILYIDEIATLGTYQKHLLTAMQDKVYPITGRNPQSSGAAVRVDNVPCDFILFAACNFEDLTKVLPALRSRIRGYGYEIVLDSWTDKTDETEGQIAQFVAQTVVEDGRIPHFTTDAVREVITIAEDMAYRLEGKRNSVTLRLRELGGLVRISGDLAVGNGDELVLPEHVKRAQGLSRGIGVEQVLKGQRSTVHSEDFGDYFF